MNLSRDVIKILDLAAARDKRGEYIELVEIVAEGQRAIRAAEFLVFNDLCELRDSCRLVITDKGRSFVADSKA